MVISIRNARLRVPAQVAAVLVIALPMTVQSADPLDQIAHGPLQHSATFDTAAIPGYGPVILTEAYSFRDLEVKERGKGQVIALVDAYDDPTVEADLATFSTQFGLPACTTANGCLKVVYAGGIKPSADPTGWSNEIAIDTQWA